MKIAPDGTKEYKGAIDVLVKVCRHEGVFALWKGFWPYYFRLGPHTVSHSISNLNQHFLCSIV